MEAMRCLRRRLSDAVYRQLMADAPAREEASPGGHPGQVDSREDHSAMISGGEPAQATQGQIE